MKTIIVREDNLLSVSPPKEPRRVLLPIASILKVTSSMRGSKILYGSWVESDEMHVLESVEDIQGMMEL